MGIPDGVVAGVMRDAALMGEFGAICDCGGRLAGTESERAALALVRQLGAAATGVAGAVVPAAYGGWRALSASLTVEGVSVACLPLVRSAGGVVEAEVVDMGRGTVEEFAASGDVVRGRVALVRHEYMFSSSHVHRRRKYAAAVAAGAAGFLIAGPLPGGVVAGSLGRGEEAGMPAFGISPEGAARVAGRRVRMALEVEEFAAETETVLFDVPGREAGWVVLSAHVDGHVPAESAIDNASGVAVALAVARALAPYVGEFRRGLRLAVFSAEEWALTGSRVWLAGLPASERESIALNVNLDSVGGARSLTALCSGFPGVGALVREVAGSCGVPIGVHMPLMENSDHANFAAVGIPALRLVAGFEEPGSEVRHVLTAADTRDKVREGELRLAAVAAASLVWEGLMAGPERAAAWRAGR